MRFSSGGLAFRSQRQPTTLDGVAGEFSTTQQSVQLVGSRPEPWEYRADSGAELARDVDRLHRRSRLLRWDVADIAAFAATAMWTYLSVPFLAALPGVQLEQLRPQRGLRRLRVQFPAGIVTHCAVQVLHVDDHGLIRRHDYPARAIGRWARATHTVDEYRPFGGLQIAT